ncbi:MAG: FtsX-like permease family protein, partial [Gemmatimonadaceae bacterium]
VLSGVGLAVALPAARAAHAWVVAHATGSEGNLPFWYHASLSPSTAVYAGLLALVGAAVAGVLPALKITAGGLDARLRRVTAGGGGPRFGGVWTAVIVTQVAVTVAFPVTAFFVRVAGMQTREMSVPLPAHEFLAARLEMDRDTPSLGGADTSQAAHLARFDAAYAELRRRLSADPAVRGVTYASSLPRMFHQARMIEVDAGGAAPLDGDFPAYRVSSVRVAADYFDVLGAPAVAGRGFGPADADTARHLVVVNRSFVRRVLGDRNPLGRRLRYVQLDAQDAAPRQPGPWYEIVGVVPDLGTSGEDDPKISGIYHAVPASGAYPGAIAVHLRGDPMPFAPRLRALVTAAEPALRLSDVARLDLVNLGDLEIVDMWFQVLLALSFVALALSLASIYAVMAFTVARRTREIGVRVALGASPRRVVTAIFRRPLTQVSLGILGGAVLVGALLFLVYGNELRLVQGALLLGYAALMLAVCLLACVIPTRRALAVQPTEALRAE